MRNLFFKVCLAALSIVAVPRLLWAQTVKKLYLPEKIWMVPENNNFKDTSSKYNFAHHAESANFAAFWAKSLGKSPAENKVAKIRFSPDTILQQCERFYKYYIDTLQFVKKNNSVANKYKILIIIFDDNDGTAYGGASNDTSHTGILWAPPVRISQPPYGAVAHELGHVFQSFITADGGAGFQSAPTMYEMTSQYMLWQVYPEWLTFENYHLKAFLDRTHLAFLHPDNQYHSPFVLEYWSEKHGKDFIGRLWRSAQKEEDAVMVYKRINHLSQVQFNDEIFDACRHFVNWNLPRIKAVAKPYAHLHHTKLIQQKDNWYQTDSLNSPQNYGYNAVPLKIPADGQNIRLQFEGDLSSKGYNGNKTDLAGWRYGFAVEKENGETICSPTYSKSKNKVLFKVPAQTKYLWLVVMGAPAKHVLHLPGKQSAKVIYEQWPYRFQLTGTDVVQPAGS